MKEKIKKSRLWIYILSVLTVALFYILNMYFFKNNFEIFMIVMFGLVFGDLAMISINIEKLIEKKEQNNP